MKVVDRFKVNKPAEGPRKFTFEFTAPGLISVAVVTIFGLLWVFILGVLVGRGYKPENAVPELAQIMPAPAPAAQAEPKEPPTVLKPEELQFMDSLQGKKPPETVTVDSTKKPADKPAEPKAPPVIATSTLEKTPAPLPKGQVATAPAQPDKKAPLDKRNDLKSPQPDRKTAQADTKSDKKTAQDKKTQDKAQADKKATQDRKAETKAQAEKKPDAKTRSDAKAQPDKKAEAKPSGEGRFTVTYQIAAFDDKKVAQAESDRFNAQGLKTSIHEHIKVDGKPVYRVLAQFRGTDAEIKAAMGKLGAKKPILREKKPL